MTLLAHYVAFFICIATVLISPVASQEKRMADSEYVRFGKRGAADYVRFGKRADADYVRFGKRADADYVRFGKRGFDETEPNFYIHNWMQVSISAFILVTG